MKRLLILFFLGLSTSLYAQDSLRNGVKYGFLPVLSFNSDDGVLVGGELKRYDYRNTLPFKSFTRVALNYYTDGAFGFTVFRDEVSLFGSDYRASTNFFTGQNFTDYYLGDTDKLGFDEARFDSSSYYDFKSFRVDVGGYTRIPISREGTTDRFDLKIGLRFIYETPWGTPENRFIYEQNIEGRNGAFLSLLDLGLIIERRDSEFRAEKGYLIDLGSRYAPPGISTHHTIENYILALGFIPLTKKMPLTLASRVRFQNTLGKTPYWFSPFLGGGTSLRGYMYRRFTSDNALSYSLELRSWLFKIPFKNIELGANFFVDGGKAFSNENWDQAFNKHNLTLGFGGVMSIFTPDYILKYDIGFSEDGIGIYLGTGYSF
ncbi:MAG: hypothetical protein BalsKO_03740 [Balneolaceae bacterium]